MSSFFLKWCMMKHDEKNNGQWCIITLVLNVLRMLRESILKDTIFSKGHMFMWIWEGKTPGQSFDPGASTVPLSWCWQCCRDPRSCHLRTVARLAHQLGMGWCMKAARSQRSRVGQTTGSLFKNWVYKKSVIYRLIRKMHMPFFLQTSWSKRRTPSANPRACPTQPPCQSGGLCAIVYSYSITIIQCVRPHVKHTYK